jgi:hypothetical protein
MDDVFRQYTGFADAATSFTPPALPGLGRF